MLKIMFVDDEINVINGLTEGYDWESLGFEVVATATSTEEALKQIPETLPNVIITDVCMGDRNGISLITEVRVLYPKIELIILSGYPEFRYAKAAMEQGVSAYLLKPLKSSELFKTLEQIKVKLEQHQSSSSTHFFSTLLQLTPPTTDSITELCHKYSIIIPKSFYTLIVFQYNSSSFSDITNELEQICIEVSAYFNHYYPTFSCQPKPGYISIVIFHEQTTLPHSLYMRLDFFKHKIRTQYNHRQDSVVGISNSFSDILNIQDAYLQALFAVSQKSFFGNECTITYNENSTELTDASLSSSCFLQMSQQEDLLRGIKTGNETLVHHTLENYFHQLNTLHNVNSELIKNVLLDIIFQIIHSVAPDTSKIHIIFGKNVYPVTDVQKMTKLSEIQEYIYWLVDKILEYKKALVTHNYSKIVTDTLVFIMNNYTLPISIDTIAQELYINRYQLMRTFKAETGDTINNYLINYRMRIAIEFLNDRKLTIQEISARVGYQDSETFSKMFKKHIGCLPSEYKQQGD